MHRLRIARLLRLGSAALVLAVVLLAPLLVRTVRAAAPAGHSGVATAQVTIQNFSFSPRTLTVAPGTTVVWTQKDRVGHTVASDTNAWQGSPVLEQGQTFSVTFARPGVYRYHCTPHPYMQGTIVVRGLVARPAAVTAHTGMSLPLRIGQLGKLALPVFTGWYDGARLLYLVTDTSSKAEAAAEHINYAPALARAVKTAGIIYLVTNGPFAAHGAVFNATPGDRTYSPLWQEVLVTWKVPSRAVALGKDAQITALVAAGRLTAKQTGIVVNCPILPTPRGGRA